MLINTGIPTEDDFAGIVPSEQRFAAGAVAVIECFQEIPCDPCVKACNRKAITIDGDINGLPVLNPDLCNGCGFCITSCPGLAIFVIDKAYSDSHALVDLPFEYVPVPEAGQTVTGLNRAGDELGEFEVKKVLYAGSKNKTHIVSIVVPINLAMEVRDIKVE